MRSLTDWNNHCAERRRMLYCLTGDAMMSRSYKRTPVMKCCGDSRYGKRQANKKVRRSDKSVLYKRKQYRKVYESWDINDVVLYWSKRDAEKSGELDDWKKYYYRK